MTKNIGRTERVARVAFGLLILSQAFIGLRTPWAYFGMLPVLSGAVGWCPPYALLGISTDRARERARS